MSESEIVYGVFKEEIKNRFLCIVSVDGEDVVCYIPSSCRLSNFIDMTNKIVMLRPVRTRDSHTQYTVYAVKQGRQFIMLNLSQPNKVIESQMYRRYFAFLGRRKCVKRETTIEGYKSDLYVEDSKTLIEIKSILAFGKKSQFPTVYSERAINQLKLLLELLDKGYRVCYLLISLNPKVKTLYLNKEITEYYVLFTECISKGMQYKGFSLKLNGVRAEIYSKIEVVV